MSQQQQPEALRVAAWLITAPQSTTHGDMLIAGRELRRLHARVLELEAWQEEVRSNSPLLARLERAEQRVQELETQLARMVYLPDYLQRQDAVIIARKTYEAMRSPSPQRPDPAGVAAQAILGAEKDELYRSRIGLQCSHCKTGKYRADSNGYNDFHRCDKCRHVPMWHGDGQEFAAPKSAWVCLLCRSSRPGHHGFLIDGITPCPEGKTS